MAFFEYKVTPAITATYDPQTDTAYLQLVDGDVVDTLEITKGVLADVDAAGKLLGVELLYASDLKPADRKALKDLADKYDVPSLKKVHPELLSQVYA